MMNSDERQNKKELWMAVFGARLSRFMKEQGVSISDLSKETGITRQTIRKYLTGKSSPEAFNVYSIAKVLKISFDDFWDL